MEIKIRSEYITLSQFLKFTSLAGSGGDAKRFIQLNSILVNGTPTMQRGKKLHPGDKVVVNDQVYIISG